MWPGLGKKRPVMGEKWKIGGKIIIIHRAKEETSPPLFYCSPLYRSIAIRHTKTYAKYGLSSICKDLAAYIKTSSTQFGFSAYFSIFMLNLQNCISKTGDAACKTGDTTCSITSLCNFFFAYFTYLSIYNIYILEVHISSFCIYLHIYIYIRSHFLRIFTYIYRFSAYIQIAYELLL